MFVPAPVHPLRLSCSGLVVSMSNCGVRTQFESHHRQLRLSPWPLRYAALGLHTFTAVQYLGQLALRPSGIAKSVPAVVKVGMSPLLGGK